MYYGERNFDTGKYFVNCRKIGSNMSLVNLTVGIFKICTICGYLTSYRSILYVNDNLIWQFKLDLNRLVVFQMAKKFE